MATTFKTLTAKDVASTRNLLHEAFLLRAQSFPVRIARTISKIMLTECFSPYLIILF